MNKSEQKRRDRQELVLLNLGFTNDEIKKLIRISHTLRNWFEYECGTSSGQVMRSIERDGDEPDSKPYLRIQYPRLGEYVDRRYPIADRETGARKRLLNIIIAHAARTGRALSAYVQTDPRGCAIYILRPGDVPAGEQADAYYSRGIPVY